MTVARALENTVRDALSHSSGVVVLGPRQVGKTTLARSLAASQPNATVFLDLEKPGDAQLLATNALPFLQAQAGKLVVIDEVQRAPGLFQVLRVVIDERRRSGTINGHFLLTGSASRELLRQSSESLAGRVVYHELTPFRADEATGLDPDELWLRGGMPLSALAPTREASAEWRDGLITTYLERDIAGLGIRTPATTMRRLWTMLAHHQGGLLNSSDLANGLGLAARTVTHHVDILQDLMLVRRLPPWFANVGKRLVKSPKVYVRDSGILHALLGLATPQALLSHPAMGQSWEGFVLEQLIAAAGHRATPYFYRTAAGAEVDLLLEMPRERIAVEIKRSPTARPGKGFVTACDELAVTRRLLVTAGEHSFDSGPLGIRSVRDAMRVLAV